MTKKELKQMEDARQQKYLLRCKLVDALENYHKDLDAFARVCKINGEELTDETRQKVLDNYPTLTEYGYKINRTERIADAVVDAINVIARTERVLKRYSSSTKFEFGLSQLDLVYEGSFRVDITGAILLHLAQTLGYEIVMYMGHGITELADLVDMGCKVMHSVREFDTDGNAIDVGLVLDITHIDLGIYCAARAERERNQLIKHDATWGRVTPQEKLDEIDAKYKALHDFVSA